MSIFTNIGILYSRLNQFDNALNSYNKGLELCQKLQFDKGVVDAFTNIGNLYDESGKYTKALNYYYKSLSLAQQINNLYGIASAQINIGITLVNLKNYDDALIELEKSMLQFEKLKNSHNLAIVHQNIGYALMKKSRNTQQDLISAELNFKKSITYGETSNSLGILANTTKYLSQLKLKQKKYEEAYKLQSKAIQLKDSLQLIEKKEEIARLESQHKFEKKELKLKSRHEKEQTEKLAEISHQKYVKNNIIIGGSIVLIGSMVGFVLYRKKQEAESKAKDVEFKIKVADLELKALKAQIKPHFLYNALTSIGSYILKNDSESANDYLTRYASLVRRILENSREDLINVNSEIELLKKYLNIEQKRLQNKFSYQINVLKEIDAEITLLPPLTLQPFIENSIIHGISPLKGQGKILIEFSKYEDNLICIVDDNGIGRKASKQRSNFKKVSLGIDITKSRIDLMHKNAKTNIEIIDKKIGTCVKIKLPIIIDN